MKRNYTTGTRPTEEAYFHTGNSGITARVIETKIQYETDAEQEERMAHQSHEDAAGMALGCCVKSCSGDRYFKYKMEFVHGAHGISSTMSTPLMSPEQIDIYIDMLERTKKRMLTYPDYTPEHSLDPRDQRRVLRMKNGYEMREAWSEEIVVSKNSTSSFFLGHHLYENGVCKGFEPHDGPTITRGMGQASDGCDSEYGAFTPDEIGRPYLEVMKNRPAVEIETVSPRRAFKVEVGEDLDAGDLEDYLLKLKLSMKNKTLD